MKQTIILTLLAALALATVSYAAEGGDAKQCPVAKAGHAGKGGPAGDKGGPGGPGGERMGNLLPPRLVEDLNLTADQQKTLADLQAKFEKGREEAMAANGDEMKKLRAEMKAAHEAEDKAKMKEVGEKMRVLAQPVMELRKQCMEQFRTTLTPEQQAKLDEAKKRMEEHRGAAGKRGEGKAPKGQ